MSIGAKNKAVSQVNRTPSPAAASGALVEKTKARRGITSDTKLLEVALANLAVGDDYADWLVSRRGTIPKDIKLGC